MTPRKAFQLGRACAAAEQIGTRAEYANADRWRSEVDNAARKADRARAREIRDAFLAGCWGSESAEAWVSA